MDEKLFNSAMRAAGLNVIHIDEQTDFVKLPSPFRPLHPTLRKCKCGYVASSYLCIKHIEDLLKAAGDMSASAKETFWMFHGEVPYYGEEKE